MSGSKLYLISGEEPFLVEETLTQLQSTLQSAQPGLKEVRLKEETTLSEMVDKITMVDMFAPSQLFLVRGPSFLMSALEKDQHIQFKSLCESIQQSPHVVVFYLLGKKFDMRKKQNAFLKTCAKVSVHDGFKAWEMHLVSDWVQKRAGVLGLTLSPDALEGLLQLSSGDVRFLAAELDRLKAYLGSETAVDMAAVRAVSAGGKSTIFDLMEALQSRQRKAGMSALKQLLDAGDEPVQLMGFLASQVRFYYQMCLSHSEGQSPDQIAKILKKNPFYIKKLLPSVVKHYSVDVLRVAYGDLCRYDVSIKTGAMKPKQAVFLAGLGVLG